MEPYDPKDPLRHDATDEQIVERFRWLPDRNGSVILAREYAAAVAEPLHRQISIMVEQDLAASVPSPAATEGEREEGLWPSEALFGFMGWLTSRAEVSGPFSATEWASPAADLVAAFCKSQGLADPRDDYHKRLKPYPEGVSGDTRPPPAPASRG